MKKNIIIAAKLTIVMLLLCCVVYPLFIAGIGKFTPGKGNGEFVTVNNKIVGYKLIGQKFDEDKYFNGRPSAVNYNAAGSAGSNKGPTNPEYLQLVQGRIDTFLAHNREITKRQIPAELVTASASGLDPDISPSGAFVQVKRISKRRNIPEERINKLIDEHIQQPLLGVFGPSRVNVLALNIALDQLR